MIARDCNTGMIIRRASPCPSDLRVRRTARGRAHPTPTRTRPALERPPRRRNQWASWSASKSPARPSPLLGGRPGRPGRQSLWHWHGHGRPAVLSDGTRGLAAGIDLARMLIARPGNLKNLENLKTALAAVRRRACRAARRPRVPGQGPRSRRRLQVFKILPRTVGTRTGCADHDAAGDPGRPKNGLMQK